MNTAFMFLVATLALSFLVVRYFHVVNYRITLFGEYLSRKPFPSHSAYEHNKFALLRMCFGLILIARSIYVAYFLLPSEYESAVGLWVFGELIAGILVFFGLFTQWAFIFLMAYMWRVGDFIVLKYTLGNDVGGMLALMLMLTNSGKYLSIDRIILKKSPDLTRMFFYYYGDPTAGQIALAKFIALLSYWALCIYSVAQHLNEPAWTSGIAGPLLLTSNFMSTYYLSFDSIFAASEYAVLVARASMWIMMFWYPLIVPFVLLGGLFRLYIIGWGILFFLLSFFALKLGYLAEIEFVFWAAIFWSCVGISQKQSLLVFYDDRCNLCDRTVKIITFLDIFKRISLKPISINKEGLDAHGITLDDALGDLYGVNENKSLVKSGYDFYILLAKTLVLLWPLLPFLYLGKVLRVGPAMYRFIADRRRQLFGVCELSVYQDMAAPMTHPNRTLVVNAVFVQVLVLLVFYFACVPMLYLGINREKNIGSLASRYYGIAPIDVFNKTDLRMAENWFTLFNHDFNELVPLFTNEGSRLMFHKSDRVIFGHTGPYRRGVIGLETCSFDTWNARIVYLSKIYLSLKHAKPGTYTFTYKQMHQPLPDWDSLLKNIYKKNDTTVRCTADFSVSYFG